MARPKNPRGNTSPRRYAGGRPPTKIDLQIRKDALRTLKILAAAAGMEPEAWAAAALTNAVDEAWRAYDAEIQRQAADEWNGGVQ